MDTEQKLNILADSSKYDLACACKYKNEPPRQRGPLGRWIYPAALPTGQKVFLLKTLQSNACVNDCSYCPFNQYRNLPRCTLAPDELARTFMQLQQGRLVSGLFLSSGIHQSAPATMQAMLATVEILRKRYQFRGYVHLKILPGSDDYAVEQALRLATRVSINIEAPNAPRLQRLSSKKRFLEDIISVMKKINQLRREKNILADQTTQFVVGAAGETDQEIVQTTAKLYRQFHMERVYFSAFQNPDLPPPPPSASLFADLPDNQPFAQPSAAPSEIFIREHRLYQVDFLLRKYGFSLDDIYFDPAGNLSLRQDPKTTWAARHQDFFPLSANRASRGQLLRVPGIGPLGAKRIIAARHQQKINNFEELKNLGIRSAAQSYLIF